MGRAGPCICSQSKIISMGGMELSGRKFQLGQDLASHINTKRMGALAIAYMGDGAADQGQVAESYNMASLWKLPVLFIVENNQYSMGTSAKRHAAGEFYRRGEGFDIKGEKVNGMDIFAVREAASRALEYIRAGNGPYILEMVTYRYRGHSMSDPQKYRAKEEVEQFKMERDPIEGIVRKS